MPSLQHILHDRFAAAIAAAFGPEHAGTDPLIRPSTNDKFGDYQVNVAMSLAKAVGGKPRDVAQKILDAASLDNLCARTEIAGPGFINLHLKDAFVGEQVSGLRSDERLGVPCAEPAQHIVVDYSGPNVAKEMHVGHLRSSVIGDAIARVLEFQGHRVTRQNHLGDWGTQFGMLIEFLSQSQADGRQHDIADLNAFYQQAKKKFDEDPTFADAARRRVVALQGGDEKTLAQWRYLVDQSQHHFNAVYERLGVKLTDADVRAESFYNERLPRVVEDLERAGLLRQSQGAAVVYPEGFKDPEGNPQPMIVRKSDGGYLYATTDLAAARFRVRELNADRVVYVTDSRQSDHFAMVFDTLKKAGFSGENTRLDHVPFGTVLGPDKKPFKTRSGDTVKLADLLDEAVERAMRVVSEKNPDLHEQKKLEIAQAVGIGALKYADLSSDRVKDYVFDWDRMLSFDGNTAPYLQNAYVRIRSIFRKAEAHGLQPVGTAAPITITTPQEHALAVKLLQLPSVVDSVAESLEPHRLCNYLYELASLYHRFYETCPVLTAPDDAVRTSRLALSNATARTLQKGLDLLGISVVEQM